MGLTTYLYRAYNPFTKYQQDIPNKVYTFQTKNHLLGETG